eukprot:TRINITY_DN3158_c0_g1_i7.p1 TRINITY_DN3158_c0_g1~~TRINITY_DN3158_c0_g1_i7.p1  ORF type:complete len:240 (+),score=10.76 TRINITY_DN3158_c0_g1_i7:89-808(+)
MCIRDRYDIKQRKLKSIASVKEYSFPVGEPRGTNEVSEFIPSNGTLVPKNCMKYSKCLHRAQKINDKVFATIGGYHNDHLAYCEEYSIENDAWKTLPELIRKRASPGSVFLSNRFLYAIGGYECKNTIEMLDFNEKKLWSDVDFRNNRMSFETSVVAMPISDSEILILSANEKMQVGLLNNNFRAIIEWPSLKLKDSYKHNQVPIIGKDAYIFGFNGHMHILNMDTKQFEELNYNSIYS